MTRKDTLKIIGKAEKEGWTSFHHSGLGLTSIPEEIGRLTNLTELWLDHNRISTIPDFLANLPNLAVIALSYNRIENIPDSITKLTNLTHVYLSDNQIRSIPKSITMLTNLVHLDLRGNRLTTIPESLAKLVKLENLYLSINQIMIIPESLTRLTRLTRLSLSNNGLTAIPESLGGLTNLIDLDLSGNKLAAIPESLTKLTNLTELDLSRNRLATIPESLTKLTNLTELSLLGNGISILPESMDRLTNLAILDLFGNRIGRIPESLGRLSNLMMLNLGKNPLPIPPEILEKIDRPAEILAYYYSHIHAREKRSLNEAKMILVGEGTVGKTCIVNRLIRNIFDPNEKRTEGISVEPWSVQVNGRKIRLNVWDFGGQEIMHATHQFLLTRRSLYILVLEARKEEKGSSVEYWLKLIESYGGDSPVIVVINKIDEHKLDIDERGLARKYPIIKGFAYTSCLAKEGIEHLREMIKNVAAQLEHIAIEWVPSWFAIKTMLEEMTTDLIPYRDYDTMCATNGIDEISRRTLISFLHDLGIVLHFDDPRLVSTNILNPEWVTGGVYRILNSNLLFQSKGILDTDSLRVILDDPVYPPDRQLLIVDMMRKFELCFTFEGRPERHLIPDLLPKEQPELNWQENGDLRFEYHYNFLPSSVISRFIVRAHQLVARNTYWRTGVVLEYNGNKALIRADLEDKKVFISIIGTERTRREFLAIIRSHFEGIHSSIAKIVADEKAPLPSHPEIVADYRHLRQLEEMGEESFVPEGLKERVSVKRLLDGIEPYEARLKRTREEYEIMHEKGHRDIWDSDLKNTSPGIKEKNASPWISGLFYLFSAVVLLALVAIISNNISPYSLPVVIIGGILLLSIIGALQLKHDNRLADKTFLQLMMETLKRLPLIGRGKKAQ